MRFNARLCVAVGLTVIVGLVSLPANADDGADAERVATLIKQLGADEFAQREAASKELEAIGEPALAPLREAAKSGRDAEVRLRAAQIIKAIAVRTAKLESDKELAKLQGTWSLVSYETDGKQIKGEDKSHTFTVKGDTWSIHVGGAVFQAGKVARIEAQKKLNAIDLLITEGGNIGATATSIYAVEGDSLKYLNCGDPRATAFTTEPGDGRHYLTFRRAKP
jgi:uncharacterized protein (TIGR03067 family)